MKRPALRALVAIVVVLCICFALTYFVVNRPHDSSKSAAKSQLSVSEENVFTNLEGVPISFTEYEGKVRVVNLWASWTPFSIEELKNLELLAAEYATKNVVVLGINRKEPKEQAIRFLSELPQFSHIIFVIDLSDAFYKSIGGYAMPETIFYDTRGNITFHQRGEMTLEEMKIRVEEARAVE